MNEKEVLYELYCGTCKYDEMIDEEGGPVPKCEECQATPYNIDSHKPINYKEKSKK